MMLHLQVTLFLLLICGVAANRLHIIDANNRKKFTDLIIYIILPCNIINSFRMEFTSKTLENAFIVLVVSFGVQILQLFLSKILFPKVEHRKKVVLQYATICSNAGFMGNPIALGLYGAEGLLYASIALIPLRFFMWSAGLSLFTVTDNKKIIKNLLTHPCIIAVAIGFIIMIFGIKLPIFLGNAISAASNCTTAMTMFVIGAILSEVDFKKGMEWLLIYYSAMRLIVIPLIVFVILKLFNIEALLLGVIVILVAMPAGSTTAMLAEKYDGDSDFASRCIFISTLLSILTLPVINFII